MILGSMLVEKRLAVGGAPGGQDLGGGVRDVGLNRL